MNRPYTVLIADRNPRIRDFLQRELNSEGHRVVTAKNCDQLKKWLDKPVQLDALVLDPNMPGLESNDQLVSLVNQRPSLPIVFHCLASDCAAATLQIKHMTFVEKKGDSIDDLKRQLRLLFEETQPASQTQ